ncbi:hypothetical protein O3P69_019086 [Scylla paramamosain]|uniref:Uncharacterized protein n=1 Tax=Scylla paramamosain TaxID=85552 RepID=A0AAW0T7T2_SCYPA
MDMETSQIWEDEEEEFLLLAVFGFAATENESRERRKRRVWSRQVLLEQSLRGEHNVFMEFEKKANPGLFYAAYKMSPDTFDEILVLLGPHLVKETSTFRDSVGIPERLDITLRQISTALEYSTKKHGQHRIRTHAQSLIGFISSAHLFHTVQVAEQDTERSPVHT